MSARMANGRKHGDEGDQLVTRKQAMALMQNVFEKAWEEQIGPKLAYHQRDAERAKRAVEELRKDYDTRARDYEEAVQSLRAAHHDFATQVNFKLGEVSEDFEGLTRWIKSVQELAEKLEKRMDIEDGVVREALDELADAIIRLEHREPWWKFWTWRWW